MAVLAFVTYTLACWVAFHATRARSAAVAVGVACSLTFVYGGPLFVLRLFGGPFSAEPVQLALVGLYAGILMLLPSGLLRQISPRRPGAALAVLAAALLPFAGTWIATTFGHPTDHAPITQGRLTDLLFLHPLQMLEGVTRHGDVPIRFRVHHVALVAVALAGLSLHFVPGRRVRRPRAVRSSDVLHQPDEAYGSSHYGQAM